MDNNYIVRWQEGQEKGICHFYRDVFYRERHIGSKEEAEALAKELSESFPRVEYTVVELPNEQFF